MSEGTTTPKTVRWDLYGWAVVTVLMTLFMVAAVIGMDAVLPFLIVPAFVLFFIIVLPLLFRPLIRRAP